MPDAKSSRHRQYLADIDSRILTTDRTYGIQMTIGEIIGTVTLSRSHPSLRGGRLKLAVPLSLENLQGVPRAVRQEAMVVYDEQGAGLGSHVAISEGGEAAQPFHPRMVPLDAYVAALLDNIHLISHSSDTAT